MTTVGYLTVGTRVQWDGELWTVTEMSGGTVRLEGRTAPRLLAVNALVASADFRMIGADWEPQEATGPALFGIPPAQLTVLRERERHIREMLTGFRSGTAALPEPDEPRPQYAPDVPLLGRYEAKANEMGLSVTQIRRLATAYSECGVAALIDGRKHTKTLPLGRVDPRWIAAALEYLSTTAEASQPPKRVAIDAINRAVEGQFGDAIALPSQPTAYRVLKALGKGRQSFAGSSAKGKRNVASRPLTPYGRLTATRVGEYIVLDSTPLDVYAMDAVTLKWVPLELTLAVDWHTRSIVGLRLSPMSSNAVDAAMVIYEALCPNSTSHTSSGILPYAGVPDAIVVPTHSLVEGLPGGSVETIIIDHGKMYMAEHVRAACARLQVSVQPAQVRKPTDKGPLERLFGYIRTELLSPLKGYKGPDVFSRGASPEGEAFYFIHELEAMIRDWAVHRYHVREHPALRDQNIPKLTMSPDEMWQRSITQTGGALRVPARPDLVYDFLPVAWRTIQHYGVEVNLVYDGEGLEGFRDMKSPYVEQHGKWPIRYDPGDARRVFFQRPDDLSWHSLEWIYASDFNIPFSFDALRFARDLAAQDGRGGDDRAALIDLLARWDAGIVEGRRERRVALRMAERIHHLIRENDDGTVPAEVDVDALPRDVESTSGWVASDDDTGEELDQSDLYYDDVFEVGQ